VLHMIWQTRLRVVARVVARKPRRLLMVKPMLPHSCLPQAEEEARQQEAVAAATRQKLVQVGRAAMNLTCPLPLQPLTPPPWGRPVGRVRAAGQGARGGSAGAAAGGCTQGGGGSQPTGARAVTAKVKNAKT
jgi:hypothetical protein